MNIQTLKYGPDSHQVGDLYLTEGKPKATLCLFHGGFWMLQYDRHQMDAISIFLLNQGYTVWNIEYRRAGYEGGGYPGTLEDVIDAVNYLGELSREYHNITMNQLYFIGHSAGGHLAFWLSKKGKGVTDKRLLYSPIRIIGLAPALDLVSIFDLYKGKYVLPFIGGAPQDFPDRYKHVSPIEMLPLNHKQLIIIGEKDSIIPVKQMKDYISKASSMNEEVQLIEVEGGEHMDFVDSHSSSFIELLNYLDSGQEGQLSMSEFVN
ncbi:alpha/beta hydrolase [Spirochaeta cellobiosiphila]|uniref:alpha/beta hydrolase n=1 Tax=Spirochaeta cellobiosiphila TaxID=504483 RepID=UPI000411AB12|nr:alpha/beta hydrolase [Spirochaeta cellobiosiphila]